jgi:hypothetical protein
VEAAQLSSDLLNIYGHGVLQDSFSNVEEVFLYEIEVAEQIVIERKYDDSVISDFLTIIDMGIQKQAFETEEIWLEISKISNRLDKQAAINIIDNLWCKNYSSSLKNMKDSINDIEKFSIKIIKKICDIGLDICRSRIEAANSLGYNCPSAIEEYKKACVHIKKTEYEVGFDYIYKAFNRCDKEIKGEILCYMKNSETKEKINFPLNISFLLLIVGIILLLFVGLKQKR